MVLTAGEAYSRTPWASVTTATSRDSFSNSSCAPGRDRSGARSVGSEPRKTSWAESASGPLSTDQDTRTRTAEPSACRRRKVADPDTVPSCTACRISASLAWDDRCSSARAWTPGTSGSGQPDSSLSAAPAASTVPVGEHVKRTAGGSPGPGAAGRRCGTSSPAGPGASSPCGALDTFLLPC
jgi:hypothetical protein